MRKVIFHILHPDKNYQDENDKSIVIFARFGNYNFLFLGDVSRKIEENCWHMIWMSML